MLKYDSLLTYNNRCIKVFYENKWILFNPQHTNSIVANDDTINILNMLETPKYFGELALDSTKHFSHLNREGLAKSVNILINAGIISINETAYVSDSLKFEWNTNVPEIVAVHATNKCNLNCTYCYNKEFRHNNYEERSKEEWDSLLHSFLEMGITRFDITGGEPLLRDDLLPIFTDLKKKGAEVELLTNGTLIDNYEVAEAIGNSFSRVTVSLDSCEEVENDCYRGFGTYNKVVEGLKYLTEHGIKWQAKGVLHDKNASSFIKTKDFINDLSGETYALSVMVGHSRSQEAIFSQYYKPVIEKRVEDGDISLYPNPNFDFDKKYGTPCAAARYEVSIDPRGYVYPCRALMMDDLKCGNVFIEDFASIWKNSNVLNEFRNIEYTDIERCGQCAFLRICLGGCRAIAYMQTRSILGGLDPFSCALRKRRINNVIIRHVNRVQG
jgi:radical SAM protein with 4Fe4S-binding SPASM domain